MGQEYIKISAIYKKLKQAEDEGRSIYLSAPVGFGKTSAIEYYYRRKACLMLNGRSGELSDMPDVQRIQYHNIIIDDISWITEQASKEYIRDLIRNSRQHIVLAGRSKLPAWLKDVFVETGMMLADERDMCFQEAEAAKLMNAYKIQVNHETLLKILEDTGHYAMALQMVALRMQSETAYSETVRENIERDIYHYFDQTLFREWDEELKQVLMAVAGFPEYDMEFMELVTGNGKLVEVMERAWSIGNFLYKDDNGIFRMRPQLAAFLKWKREFVYNHEYISELYNRAAIYHEMHNQVAQALYYYDQSGNQLKVMELLRKNVRNHVGSAHYFETRQYYFNLPEKKIKESPMLMAGMSMLYSMLMQTDKSEYWYQQLEMFEKSADKGSEEKKIAIERLAYLDIGLPHRGTKGITSLFKKVAVLCMRQNVRTSDFCVTGNLPTLMNGGKDFCEWSKWDRECYRIMKRPLELVTGKSGVGLADTALAESLFEKGSEDIYEIIALLNSGYMMADTNGTIEMCFASTGIMCRIHISRNQAALARKILGDFRIKAIREKANQLLRNIDTMEQWMNLLEGNQKEFSKWMRETAPNENIEFNIFERYRYITKVRAYIACGCLAEAISLIDRLNVYFVTYERHYMYIENLLLKAIVQYRMKFSGWEFTLDEALQKSEDYHLVQMIANEGCAILPLLRSITRLSITKAYRKQVEEAVVKMSEYYPCYLVVDAVQREELTEMEDRILQLICSGDSTEDICEQCFISYNTLKFHNKNIYRKLGAKNRGEAERIARNAGLYRKSL